ncbi:MAG: VPLPA-CTERM sorting domain-containing protein [Phycisphaerae bacterium]|nr:VPLPA-CTERM sorting domain-containing protein [Phycisphaerae bacterium]
MDGTKMKMLCGMAVVAVMSAGSAMAATLNLTFTGLGPAKVVGANYNNNRTWSAGSVNSFSNYWAGEMQWKNAQGATFSTFCTQVNEHIHYNQNVTYQQVALEQVPDSPPAPGPMGALKATVLRDLYARFYHDVKSSGDATKNSAFQTLVWEITHENVNAQTVAGVLAQLSLATGAFQLSNSGNSNLSVFNAANSMLADLGGADNNDYRGFNGMLGLRHDTAQDQILIVPIPIPALLAGVGLIGLGVLRRRMK